MNVKKRRTAYRCAGILIAGMMMASQAVSAVKVYPRLLTPGEGSGNNRIFFEYDYVDEPRPTLRIYDIRGRKIKDISTMNPLVIATGWRIAWDGRDDGGRTVNPGVYIYQWTEGGKVIKGAVVVAR